MSTSAGNIKFNHKSFSRQIQNQEVSVLSVKQLFIYTSNNNNLFIEGRVYLEVPMLYCNETKKILQDYLV